MTPAQLRRQSIAGKASYLRLVGRALEAHWPDLELAAQHLTGSRRALAFRGRKGVTTEYMWRKA